MVENFGQDNFTLATTTWSKRPSDIAHVFSAFIDLWLLGRACSASQLHISYVESLARLGRQIEVAVTTAHSTFGYVGPALFGVPRRITCSHATMPYMNFCSSRSVVQLA